MATPFKLKRSAVTGKRPGLDDMQIGELAINFYDGHLFAERDTQGVGIGTTVALLTPWVENFGGGSINYNGIVTKYVHPRSMFSSLIEVHNNRNLLSKISKNARYYSSLRFQNQDYRDKNILKEINEFINS